MTDSYSYACKDYPGMEDCPGKVTASTEDEVVKLMELHAVVAHGEDPSSWTEEDRAFLGSLIRQE